MAGHGAGSLRLRFAWRAGVLALLLALAVGMGVGFYWQGRVNDAIHTGVADHLRALEAELDLGVVPLAEAGQPFVLPSPEQFVQVVTTDGAVVASSSELTASLPLAPVDAIVGTDGPYEATIPHPTKAGEDAFVMARPILVDGATYIGIVGESLAPVETGRRFTFLLAGIGAPLLGLLVAALVWASVRFALRPVNEMTAEADRISRGASTWRLGVVPDTLELRRLAASLDDLLRQIRDAFERERRFLDDASHELRTPIAVARGELDLARSAASGDPELDAAFESALEELDRLDRLAADLLVLARARGASPSTIGPCDLGGMARRAAGTAMRSPGARPVDLRVSGEATVAGDEQALDRALANVLSNAIGFAERRVVVELSMDDEEAVITVADDGPGFPVGFLDRAFDRFARDRSASADGTGLGLAIASAIVHAHSGTIEAMNVPEGGAKVVITLPRGRVVDRATPVGKVR